MVSSLRSLLDGVIDYAGLFPPAQFEMSRAIDTFMRTADSPDSWILSRFVCPSARLMELMNVIREVPSITDFPISVIGASAPDFAGWQAALDHDATVMNEFVQIAGEMAAVEAYEIRIPTNRDIQKCIKDLKAFEEVDVFVELPWGAGIDDSLAAIAETDWLCAKARTGGQSAAAFPPASELAEFLHGAAALDLTFKLTAGLHHPLPRTDKVTGARMHGFINVLGATSFALAEDMSRSEIEDVLLGHSIEEWKFEEDRILWRDLSVELEDIEASRDIFWSIGSCSVQEALTDMAALDLYSGGL